jgi:hypothetical protein
MISVLSLWPAGAALVGVLAQHGATYAFFGIQGLVGEERPCSRRAAVSKLEIQLEYSTAIAADVGYRFFLKDSIRVN